MKQFFKNTMTLDEVKSTYRKLAMKYHPDVEGGSEELMIELNNQFEIAFAYAKKFNNTTTSSNSESSSTYARSFYTQNGWEGSRYDSSLRTKDIAKLIREYVKYCYPTYKFSVTSSRYSHISVSMMEYPIELTNFDLMKKFFDETYNGECDWVYIPSYGQKLYILCTEEEKAKAINYKLEKINYESLNQYYLDRVTWMNPVILNIFKDINNFILSYNYDDSDSMIDYFDTNFYYSLGLGKWDKPAKLVEKVARISPTKETKGAKRLTA